MPTPLFFIERLPTPIGTMLVVTDEQDRLRAADWDDHDTRMRRLLRLHHGEGGMVLGKRRGPSPACLAIEAYFAGDCSAPDRVLVETDGTAFQRLVWSALRRIPAGRTLGYATLAAQIARPGAARAVGFANAANPVGLVVPCHRVIGADRSLRGYAGGLDRKRWLLEHEGVRLPDQRRAPSNHDLPPARLVPCDNGIPAARLLPFADDFPAARQEADRR